MQDKKLSITGVSFQVIRLKTESLLFLIKVKITVLSGSIRKAVLYKPRWTQYSGILGNYWLKYIKLGHSGEELSLLKTYTKGVWKNGGLDVLLKNCSVSLGSLEESTRSRRRTRVVSLHVTGDKNWLKTKRTSFFVDVAICILHCCRWGSQIGLSSLSVHIDDDHENDSRTASTQCYGKTSGGDRTAPVISNKAEEKRMDYSGLGNVTIC